MINVKNPIITPCFLPNYGDVHCCGDIFLVAAGLQFSVCFPSFRNFYISTVPMPFLFPLSVSLSIFIIVKIFTKINSKYLYCDIFSWGDKLDKLIYVKRIRDLREDHDLTQKEIAEYLGTSQTMYARYERGANELPIRHLIALCQYYRVSADYILGFTSVRRKI